MLSLRAAAVRTRAITASPSFSSSVRCPTTTHANAPEPDRKKRHASSIDSAPGWNEDLATPSEAFIKADRETTTFDDMQQKTVDYVHLHHHDPDVEQTHATYAREEIGGPLGNPRVGEFEGVVGKDDLGPDEAQVEPDGRVMARRIVHEETVRQGPV